MQLNAFFYIGLITKLNTILFIRIFYFMQFFLKECILFVISFLYIVIRNNMFDFLLLSNKSVVFVLTNDSEECQPISI